MGDCCSTVSKTVATIPPVVFVALSIISLRYDSVDNRISCVFEANAEHVSVSWTKDGVTISETDPFFVQTLDRHIQSGTSDTYTYTAALVARVSNRPQSQFSGTFECITTYDGKRKQRTITLTAPPVPLNLSVIDTTATSVTIAWDTPLFDDRNGNTIVAYRIAYGTVSHNVPATQRRYVANSLHPNTLYQFAVFATTVVEGNSATIEVTTQEAAPSAPSNILAFNTSSTSLRVEWSPPATPNGIIRGYRITYYKSASTDTPPAVMTHDVTGYVTSYELTDLEIFTTYSISIQGQTIVLGNASTIVNATTEEDAPSPPTVVQAVNTSSTSLRVEWNPPVTSNGIIRGYRITYYSTDDPTAVMTHDVAGSETTFELMGLDIFTTYSIYIQGRTIVLGNASAIVNATTEEDAPSPPTAVQAFNTSSTSLRVEWSPPATPNGIIRGYWITYYKSASTDTPPAVMTHDVTGNVAIYELTDLEIFTTYSITIQGQTIVLGNASTIVNATTEEDDVWFQLLITDLGKQSCNQWIEQDASEKLKDVMAAIVSNVQAHCLCGFTENYLKSGFFKCFPSSKTTVTYRGVINGFGNTSSDDLIQNIEQWIRRNVKITIQTILRPVDSMCNVRIPSRDAEECVSETNGLQATTPGQHRLVGLVVGLVIGCIVLFVVTPAIMVAVGVYWIRRTPKHSEEQTTPENHQHDQHSVDNAPSLPERETPDEKEQHSNINVEDGIKIENLDDENLDDEY